MSAPLEKLLNKIAELVLLERPGVESFLSLLKSTIVPKNTILLEQNLVMQHVYFIESGLLCGMVHYSDKDVINWFAEENQIVTSLRSFITQKPSFESILAIEDCHLYYINYADLQLLYSQFPTFERLGRLLVEQNYIQLEDRTMSLQYQSAHERYNNFTLASPSLMQRISLGQLASYLGVSQETLSRIRAKK